MYGITQAVGSGQEQDQAETLQHSHRTGLCALNGESGTGSSNRGY
jgi:hypothetical protein